MKTVNLIRDLDISQHRIFEGQELLQYSISNAYSPVDYLNGPALIDYKSEHRIVPIVKFVEGYVDDFLNLGVKGNPVVRKEETYICVTENVKGCLGKILKHLDNEIAAANARSHERQVKIWELNNQLITTECHLEMLEGTINSFNTMTLWQRVKFLFTGEYEIGAK